MELRRYSSESEVILHKVATTTGQNTDAIVVTLPNRKSFCTGNKPSQFRDGDCRYSSESEVILHAGTYLLKELKISRYSSESEVILHCQRKSASMGCC